MSLAVEVVAVHINATAVLSGEGNPPAPTDTPDTQESTS